MELRFKGSRCLVLGGSSSLGLALGKRMAIENIRPVLSFRSDEGLRRIKEIFGDGTGHQAIFLDLSDPDSIRKAFIQAGDLDFMVDLAQGDLEGLVASIDDIEAAGYIEENITARALAVKMASRTMLKNRHGVMIFVSSSAARLTNPGQGYYAASKLASEAIYRNTGLELGPRGIRTISLRPGYMKTGRGVRYMENKGRKIPETMVMDMGKVVETILFFMSESAEGFNCTEISMDGGLTAGKNQF